MRRLTIKRNNSEEQLQMACVKWFSLAYPHILLHHSPNGGKRNEIEGAKFKKMGTLAGFPDIYIIKANKHYHGLYIELKNGSKGVLSESQKIMLQRLEDEGYLCQVCRTFDEFKAVVDDYLKRE